MRKIFILVFLISSLLTFGQEKYSDEDLSMYKKIIHEYSTRYKYVLELEKGKIIRSTTFWNKKFRSIHKFSYDENSNIIKNDLIDFYVKDTSTYDSAPIIYINSYNNLNQLISIKEFDAGQEERAVITEFSDYNAMGLPQKKIGPSYSENLTYDLQGNIVKKIVTSKLFDKEKVETIEYTYDENNNIISLKRKISPEEKFPIIILGGYPKYEFERFRYKYNKYGHWTKKYWIIEGKEMLFAKRKFEK